jgi:hypothetical protein
MKYLKFPITDGLKKDRYRTKRFARIPPEQMITIASMVKGIVSSCDAGNLKLAYSADVLTIGK